jgi:hypothetical protein
MDPSPVKGTCRNLKSSDTKKGKHGCLFQDGHSKGETTTFQGIGKYALHPPLFLPSYLNRHSPIPYELINSPQCNFRRNEGGNRKKTKKRLQIYMHSYGGKYPFPNYPYLPRYTNQSCIL